MLIVIIGAFFPLVNGLKWNSENETHVCFGQDAHLSFIDSIDEPITTLEWFFNSKRIAKHINELFIAQGERYKKRISLGDIRRGYIILENGSKTDEGIYLIEVNTKQNHSIKLIVYVPPKTGPSFADIFDKDGKLTRLTCKPPKRNGNPPVDMVLMDSNGFKLTSLSTAVNDYRYTCCMEGQSAECYKPKDKCVIYEIPVESCQMATKKWECIGHATSFYAAFCALVAFSMCCCRWLFRNGASLKDCCCWSFRNGASLKDNFRQIVPSLCGVGVSIAFFSIIAFSCCFLKSDCEKIWNKIGPGIISAFVLFPFFLYELILRKSQKDKDRQEIEQIDLSKKGMNCEGDKNKYSPDDPGDDEASKGLLGSTKRTLNQDEKDEATEKDTRKQSTQKIPYEDVIDRS